MTKTCGDCQNFRQFSINQAKTLFPILGKGMEWCGVCSISDGLFGEPMIMNRNTPLVDAQVRNCECDFEEEESGDF